MKPIRYNDLKVASIANDEDAKSYGWEATLLEAGIDSEDLKRYAEERGIRGALIATFDHKQMEKLRDAKEPIAIRLDEGQKFAKRCFELGIVDGIATAARASQMSDEDRNLIIQALSNERLHYGWDEPERKQIDKLVAKFE